MNKTTPRPTNTALYFERPAAPSQRPAVSQRRHAEPASGRPKNNLARTVAAAQSASRRQPSGTTQPPAEAKKNAEALTPNNAHNPARGPNKSRARANISQ